MSRWGIDAAQWAAWTQEDAVASPAEPIDTFDAELAQRLWSSGFGANLEETAVTDPQTLPSSVPAPEDSDATLIRPAPDLPEAVEEFAEAAETMVQGRLDHELEVSLEAPESGLEVGLDRVGTAAGQGDFGDRTVVVSAPTPAEDPVDGLVLPSLTTIPETPLDAGGRVEGGTVVAPAPQVPLEAPYAVDQTVIAPAPAAPAPIAASPDATAVSEAALDVTQRLPSEDEAPLATTSPTEEPEPEPARTGSTLPPTATVDVADAPQAMSSGVFRSFDIHDEDDDPAPAPARQKVVIGGAPPAAEDDAPEIEAVDLVDDAEVVEEREAPQPEAATPPPPKETPKRSASKGAPKPPPAPPIRAEAAEQRDVPDPSPVAPPVEVPPEPAPAATPSSPVAAAVAKTPGWPEEVFDEHCVAMTRPNHARLAKAEVEFFVQSTGIQPGARVLDVGCGDGTHCLVLAQRGFGVTGLDISPAQIARAERAKEALGANASFVKADMRDMPGGGPFDAILCIGTTFGYYDDEENRAVLRSLAGMLTPGGRLMLQIFNRDHIIGRLPSRSWWQGHGCLVLDEARMNFFTNRLAVHRTLVFEDGRQFEHRIQIRGYNAHEVGRLCVDAGLRVVEISGSRSTRGRFYGASSPDIWLVVEPKA